MFGQNYRLQDIQLFAFHGEGGELFIRLSGTTPFRADGAAVDEADE